MRFFISIFGVSLIIISLFLTVIRIDKMLYFVAFLSDRNGTRNDIYRINSDGEELTQLTTFFDGYYSFCFVDWFANSLTFLAKGLHSSLSCSGDWGTLMQLDLEGNITYVYGRSHHIPKEADVLDEKMLFIDAGLYDSRKIRLGNIEGNRQTDLGTLSHWYFDKSVQWSKSLSWIIYRTANTETGENQFYRIRPDGSGKELFRNSRGLKLGCSSSALSPSGEKLIFAVRATYPRHENHNVLCNQLYLSYLNTEKFGSQIQLFMNFPDKYRISLGEEMKWSPDGNWLIYSDSHNLNSVSFSNKKHTVLAGFFGDSFGYIGDWTPDSEWFIFAAYDMNREFVKLYRIHPDGTGLEQLTYGEGSDTMPTVSPPIHFSWSKELFLGIGVLLLAVGRFVR